MITSGNSGDHQYTNFLDNFRERFLRNIRYGEARLFTTDADPDRLWGEYLATFSDPQRQHHNCHACRHFIQRFGNLVTIDEFGRTTSALFSEQNIMFHECAQVVRRAKVTGVFLSPKIILGTPITGTWRHLAVILPSPLLYRRQNKQTAEQAMAEKQEDYINICRALDEFSLPTLNKAVEILRANELYRGEKVLGAAEFLRDLAQNVADASGRLNVGRNVQNIVWRAVAGAPAGLCHPRSGMLGTLLTDLAADLPLSIVANNFRNKMHPLSYQRPQAAPAAQTIARAEALVAQLNVAPALERRFAHLAEINTQWRPKETPAWTPQLGIFSHLTPKSPPETRMHLPAKMMTWDKFQRTLLPEAEQIDFFVRHDPDNYCAILTAVHADATPILQWDTLSLRNPFSWYVWHGGSSPYQFRLSPGWTPVSAVTLKPSMWHGISPNQGEAVIFVLEHARETRQAGNALFPEILKSEFHSIRSVIEAYSKQARIEGMENGNACGILLQRGIPWPYRLRVSTRNIVQEIRLDRWD